MLDPPILLTNIRVPPLRPPLLLRAPLSERIGAAWPLVVVSASAGAGKTTLLSAWARSTPDPVVWLTLSEADNNPLRFWQMVQTAFQYQRTRTARELEHALPDRIPATSPLSLAALTHLLNTLTEGGKRDTHPGRLSGDRGARDPSGAHVPD